MSADDTSETERAKAVLREHRESIDRLNAEIVSALARRFELTRAVGELKARHDLPPSDPAREAAQARKVEELAREAGLDPEFAGKVLDLIVREVVRQHGERKN